MSAVVWATGVDVLAIAFAVVGLLFMIVGTVGIVRLPDVYHRIHAASKCTTLGLMGLLIAAALFVGTAEVMLKGLLTMAFIFVAAPIGSHILAKAAHRDGAPQWTDTLGDELAEARSAD
ncbi:MAG: monovalent cation/H(+) antiporter subunit G [Planctomycetota bacterium]